MIISMDNVNCLSVFTYLTRKSMIQTEGNCKDYVTKLLLHGCLERAQHALVKPSFVKIVSYNCCKTLTTLRMLKSCMKINYIASILFDFGTYLFNSWKCKIKKASIFFFTFLLTFLIYVMFNYDVSLSKNTECNIK